MFKKILERSTNITPNLQYYRRTATRVRRQAAKRLQRTAAVTMESRLRLRPWLVSRIDSGEIHGLCWVDKEQGLFRIPWKHGSKQDWDAEMSGRVFMEWAKHTGKYRENVDKPDYAKWKTRLRCAFNKAPDIEEVKEKSRKDSSSDPYKVYRIVPRHELAFKKNVGYRADSDESEEENKLNIKHEQGTTVIPTFVQTDKDSTSRLGSSGNLGSGPMSTGMPSDLKDIHSSDILRPNGSGILTLPMPSTGSMETSGSLSQYLRAKEENQENQSPLVLNTPYTIVPQDQHVYHTGAVISQVEVMETESTSFLPRNHIGPQDDQWSPMDIETYDVMQPFEHDCHYQGNEFWVEVIYNGKKVKKHHCVSGKVRLVHASEDELKGDEVCEMPSCEGLLDNQELVPYATALLTNLKKGIVIECNKGDITLKRLCRTSIFCVTKANPTPRKIPRGGDAEDRITVYKYDNDFISGGFGPENGDHVVYLFCGQNADHGQHKKVLIYVRVIPCKALDEISRVSVAPFTDADHQVMDL